MVKMLVPLEYTSYLENIGHKLVKIFMGSQQVTTQVKQFLLISGQVGKLLSGVSIILVTVFSPDM